MALLSELIGNIPLLRRFFPNRGWYRQFYQCYSDTPHELAEPWGPYPTFDAASIGGDPMPPQVLHYHLRMPVECHDVRKDSRGWSSRPDPNARA